MAALKQFKHGSDNVFSIAELLKSHAFPVVVKDWAICDEKIERALVGINFPDEEEFLLDKVANIELADVRVCPFVNEAKTSRWKGDRYLLPALFPGKFKFVTKPGGPEHYSCIKQVRLLQIV